MLAPSQLEQILRQTLDEQKRKILRIHQLTRLTFEVRETTGRFVYRFDCNRQLIKRYRVLPITEISGISRYQASFPYHQVIKSL